MIGLEKNQNSKYYLHCSPIVKCFNTPHSHLRWTGPVLAEYPPPSFHKWQHFCFITKATQWRMKKPFSDKFRQRKFSFEVSGTWKFFFEKICLPFILTMRKPDKSIAQFSSNLFWSKAFRLILFSSLAYFHPNTKLVQNKSHCIFMHYFNFPPILRPYSRMVGVMVILWSSMMGYALRRMKKPPKKN